MQQSTTQHSTMQHSYSTMQCEFPRPARVIASLSTAAKFLGLSGLLVFLCGVSPSVPSLFAQNKHFLESFDVVQMRSGAKIEGSVKVQQTDGKKFYLVELSDGTKIKLDTKAVSRVIKPPAMYLEYLKLATEINDTVDAHWQLQDWCTKNRLYPQRDFHLRRIVQLDPEYARARGKLKYSNYNGVWLQDDHYYESQGFVRDGRRWRLPQGIRFVAQREAERKALGKWKEELRLAKRKFLRGDVSEDAFLRIKDPAAVQAVVDFYKSNKGNSSFRRLMTDVLGGIQSGASHRQLIAIYLNDPDPTVSERALTMLKQDHFDNLVTSRSMYPFMRPGIGTPNQKVERAGFAIGELEDTAGIRYLIDGIITTHQINNPRAQQGNMNVGRATGAGQGTQFSQGNDEPKKILLDVRNDSVLHSLEKLSGRSFAFDQERWLQWYIGTQTLSNVDLRRDE